MDILTLSSTQGLSWAHYSHGCFTVRGVFDLVRVSWLWILCYVFGIMYAYYDFGYFPINKVWYSVVYILYNKVIEWSH